MKALTILKIGGKLLDDESKLMEVISSFSKIKTPKVLVHGGGKRASEMSLKLGIKPQMKSGRRITDKATLDVVTMVYAGLINTKVVSLLQSINCNAIGFSGADGNVIQADKRPVQEIDFGFVGDINEVKTGLLIDLLKIGLTPVFCAITHDGNAQLLNTNADSIAAALASALSVSFKVVLKFCFEKEGVLADPLNESSVFPVLSKKDYALHQGKGAISDGMIPKLDNAFAAKSANVHKVVICGVNGILEQKGTEICQ